MESEAMSRNMWILAALLALLSLAMIYRDESGVPDPKWSLCKESLAVSYTHLTLPTKA